MTLSPHPLRPPATGNTVVGGRDVAVDNPAMAWANSNQSAYSYLDSEFVADYRAVLDAAAVALFGPVLTVVWARHGYTAVFASAVEVETGPLPDALYHRVWDQAAALLDPDLIVARADLADVYPAYS